MLRVQASLIDKVEQKERDYGYSIYIVSAYVYVLVKVHVQLFPEGCGGLSRSGRGCQKIPPQRKERMNVFLLCGNVREYDIYEQMRNVSLCMP